MGVFDKLKNALFEVEYVEVEEKQKKEKPSRPKEKSEDDEVRPIAKKIVLPGKRDEKVEEIKEEEMKDEDFEIRPINETVKEAAPTFKFMDDDDFTVDAEVPPVMEDTSNNRDSFSDMDYQNENVRRSRENSRPIHASEYDRPIHASEVQYDRPIHASEVQYDRPIHASNFNAYDDVEESTEVDNDYQNNNYYEEESYTAPVARERENKPYGVDNTTFKAAKEYGSYENKDEKSYFKPSPIISPIYGILDKNYRKEDVVAKKDIRITTNYSRSNVNVDDIRNKAYGRRGNVRQETPPVQDNSFEVEEEEEESLLVDLSDEKEKPEVKSITVGDAMEYFDDLGLEYNVDYVDATSRSKKKNNDLEEDIKNTMAVERVEEEPVSKPEILHSDLTTKEKKKIVDVKEEANTTSVDDDDNLFDLIDSMYKEDD